jgi:hypothetical protein
LIIIKTKKSIKRKDKVKSPKDWKFVVPNRVVKWAKEQGIPKQNGRKKNGGEQRLF